MFSDDIGMKFRLKKCGVLVMKRGKVVKSEGIDLPDGRRMKTVEEGGYKYLGILEHDDLLHEKMKSKIKIEYFRRLKKVLKSKLNGKNVIVVINTRAVSVPRYGAGIINWTKAELESMDRKTRKRMTIYGMLHPKANMDRLYLPRGRGGRGLISVEDCVRAEENGLANYGQTSTNKLLLVSVKNEGLSMNEEAETPKQLKERKKSDRLEG